MSDKGDPETKMQADNAAEVLESPVRRFNFANPHLPGTPRTVPENISRSEVMDMIKPLQDELAKVKFELNLERQDKEVLKDRLIKLEGYSRRYNLRFQGVKERHMKPSLIANALS